ncbi:MAG: hypothetical protein GY835_11910, partial [bacterium]|nr:hypothetical protein [bacterium]
MLLGNIPSRATAGLGEAEIAPLLEPRQGHAAAVLPDGSILVAGGKNDVGNLSSAELYDPRLNIWRSIDSMNMARSRHSATLLFSGEVLVAGGTYVGGWLGSELYDPATGTWEVTGALASARIGHTATLLPSGKVLVAGGENGWGTLFFSGAELYDPSSGTWKQTSSLQVPRSRHQAALLPTGKVLVVGGFNGSTVAGMELYDPSSGIWQSVGQLSTPRADHTATLLSSAEIVITGGIDASSLSDVEIFNFDNTALMQRPVITLVTGNIQHGGPITIEGEYFGGNAEASDGGTQNSAVNYPLINLQSLNGDIHVWLIPEAMSNFQSSPLSLNVTRFPTYINPGFYLLRVVRAAHFSEPWPVEVECGLVIVEHPSSQTVATGSIARFAVRTEGGRTFQWQKNGIDIPGATSDEYLTPPVIPADSGSSYSVKVDSGCTTGESNDAIITVADGAPPSVAVTSPSGGEYWPLSVPDESSTELITWSMSDNVRICQVEVALLYSNDGGTTYLPAPSGGDLPATFGAGGTCPHPGESTTSREYTVPPSPPSGMTRSLYKIEVRVTDHAGLTASAESEHPFFMINLDGQSVRTITLANPSRMHSTMGVSAAT